MDRNSVKERIKAHEGLRYTPYEDTLGFLTVGYGRNMDAVPFSQDEVDLMFENDFKRAVSGAETFIVYPTLNDVRKSVLIEMIFQMGTTKVGMFKKFLKAFRS